MVYLGKNEADTCPSGTTSDGTTFNFGNYRCTGEDTLGLYPWCPGHPVCNDNDEEEASGDVFMTRELKDGKYCWYSQNDTGAGATVCKKKLR